MREMAIVLGMNNVASSGTKYLNNLSLKSKRSVEKARAEGPAAWVFPADDSRPAEQASLLNLFVLQGVEVHRTERELRLRATESGRDPDTHKEKSAEMSAEKSAGKSPDDAKSKEEKKPAETVIR